MNMTIAWIVVMIVTAIIEIATASMVSVWFTIGAFAALIAHKLGCQLTIQAAVFIVVSGITGMIMRPIAYKALKGNITRTNTDSLIGKHAVITKRVDPDEAGEAKVDGQLWRVTSLDNEILEVNDYGEVVAIEGAHLILRKIIL